MTTSELVSWKTIDLVFEVRTIFWGGNFSPWISQMNGCLRRHGRAMPSEHILIWDDLQYAKGGMISNMQDKEGVGSQCIVVGRELALATLATHRWRNCKTEALFPQTIAQQSNNCTPPCFLPEMRPGPRRKVGLPGVQSDDFPESGEERSSPQGGARTGKPSLSSKNRILVHFNDGIFIFLELILMIKIQIFKCFRPGWKEGESQLGKRRRRCQQTRKRRKRRKKAQKRRSKEKPAFQLLYTVQETQWNQAYKKNFAKKSNWEVVCPDTCWDLYSYFRLSIFE